MDVPEIWDPVWEESYFSGWLARRRFVIGRSGETSDNARDATGNYEDQAESSQWRCSGA